jgi:hypothetical protein
MWAKSDITGGIPLTMAMLTTEDPVKKAEEEKKKKAEEEKKRKEKEREEHFIAAGMRAVTFPVDQKSACSSSMIDPGDLIDVLIMEARGDKIKVHKYKGMKVLAIDGLSKKEAEKNNASVSGSNLLGNVSTTLIGQSAPRNVTLEVKESLVETLLKQAGSTGIIISLRSQAEHVDEKEKNVDLGDTSSDQHENNPILGGILSINKQDSTGDLITENARKEAEERGLSTLMDNINMLNREVPVDIHALVEGSDKKGAASGKDTADKKTKDGKSGDKYEIISGKVEGDKNNVVLYRKLTPTSVKFDERGKVVTGNEGGGK